MTPFDPIRIGARALARHKTRTFLTTLGIVIGVGAVIAMMSVGEGARVRLLEAFEAGGTNLIMVRSGSSQLGGVRGGFESRPTITFDDVEAMRQLPTVYRASPRPEIHLQVSSVNGNWATDLGGVTPEFFEIRHWAIAMGRNLTYEDVELRSKVIVLAEIVNDQLFGPGVNSLGQVVRVRNVPFTVVGVLAHKGGAPGGFGSFDDNAYIPLTCYYALIQGGLNSYVAGAVFVSAVSPDEATHAEQQIRALLRERHHLADGVDDDFQVRNTVELARAQEDGARTIQALLASVAAISLLIAGIGVMNIMLVSVTERTREIGLRMAVGARSRDILAQFIIEALVLGTVGGLIGVAFGVVASQRLTAWFGWPSILRADSMIWSLVVSGGIGVLFGLYPAWRAAALDPIDALRFEL
jgi:putative ABC transport system permease protein